MRLLAHRGVPYSADALGTHCIQVCIQESPATVYSASRDSGANRRGLVTVRILCGVIGVE
jgi:hypothetical protein